jgi:hypothetical protein
MAQVEQRATVRVVALTGAARRLPCSEDTVASESASRAALVVAVEVNMMYSRCRKY